MGKVSFDERMMRRCFFLAEKGLGFVAPNPLVGCVITLGEEIVSEGYHAAFGEAHAERAAIANVPVEMMGKMREATLYVNLEPCAHFGKTPPCAPLIAEMGFKRVVISNRDPYKEVNGRGIEILKAAGIEVTEGVLEEQGRRLNRRFFTMQEKGRPYVILKWAKSADDFIGILDSKGKAKRTRLSNDISKLMVHRMRAYESAILIGTQTAVIDNPLLTVRLCKGQNPVRLLIDKDLIVNETSNIFSNDAKTIVYTEAASEEKEWGERVHVDYDDKGGVSIPQIFEDLAKRGLSSVIVEGGSATLQSFIDQGYWDEARVETASEIVLTRGIQAPVLKNNEVFRQDNFEGHTIEWHRHIE